MDVKTFYKLLSDLMYILCGLISIGVGIRGLKNEKAKIGTFLFWTIVGAIFILGDKIPYVITGGLLLVLGIITITKQLQPGSFNITPDSFKLKESQRLGNKIFIPAGLIGIGAFVLLQFKFNGVATPSVVGIGGGSLIALVVAYFMIKPDLKDAAEDTSRLAMQVGASSFLPQLLAALGAVFTASGVGTVISNSVSSIIPEGNIIIGVIIYALGMAIFTMIMGNAFAAFAVITAGIGIPFVISHGGNPVVIGALGMTAGYCGTLMTPMAANFNIVPAAVLEMKDKNTVIKTQIPMGLALLATHIVLMLILGF